MSEPKDEVSADIFSKETDIDVSHLYYIHYRCTDRDEARIYSPVKLFVAEDGHKITDANGMEHFIPKEKIFHVKCQHKSEKKSREVLVEG